MITNGQRLLGLFLLLFVLEPTLRADGLGQTESEVVFYGAGGVKLAGTMTLPVGKSHKPVPALVLIAGSGPTDRNGNQGPRLHTDLLKQIAQDLARQGIASLRYDKRGQYASESAPTTPDALSEFTAWHNYVGDVREAMQWLQGQSGIDSAHVGLLGHSEGGLLALEAAEQTRNTAHLPKVLVLIATPGRSTDEVIREQLVSLLKLQRATPEQTKFYLSRNDSIVWAIKNTGHVPDDVPAGLAPLYPAYLGKFLQEQFAVQPASLAARFSNPVLVLQGAADVQVSPDRDARHLASVRNGRNGSRQIVIVPGASHILKAVKTASDKGFTGKVVPQALTVLNSWLAVHLQSKAARPSSSSRH